MAGGRDLGCMVFLFCFFLLIGAVWAEESCFSLGVKTRQTSVKGVWEITEVTCLQWATKEWLLR